MKITENKAGMKTITFAKNDCMYFDGTFLSDGHFMVNIETAKGFTVKVQGDEANALYYQRKPFRADGTGAVYAGAENVPNAASVLDAIDKEYQCAILTNIVIDAAFNPRLIVTDGDVRVWIDSQYAPLLKGKDIMAKGSNCAVCTEDKSIVVMPVRYNGRDLDPVFRTATLASDKERMT